MALEHQIRIAILTSDTPANVYLVNRILAEHEVVAVVIESPAPAATVDEKLRRRRQLLARFGRFRTLNKLAFNWYRSRFLNQTQAKAIAAALLPEASTRSYCRPIRALTVESINSAECARTLRDATPDLIAVCGTKLVKPDIFGIARLGAVNIHTGITPEYRSADPIFWALYNRQPDKVGVTIHFVDEGIDTGPVIKQEAVPVFATDSLGTIYARCILRGAELYLEALREIESGSVRTLARAGATGKAYYSINLGIIQYLVFLARFRLMRRHLPRDRREQELKRGRAL